ncbi:dihydroorotase [Lichenicola cladoniae]|uniref:Dihydroorotase n=1 Tax=Lichenicola cladoniae TaxID=1484109 RepID=A0A6M8HLI7_9PROT|nr:dihydroorotase [Lichenicola cladoniae]NPD66030.1 dihydroorotase [Acetobacteraceae bacterium]QKE89214.1 dihydroorotase [Lichenicola cladoniae]
MAHFDLILRGGGIVGASVEHADIGCIDGRIVEISDLRGASAEQVIACKNLKVLPGLIDPHVHLRDPGDPAVETIPDGTRAAVLGGITSLFDMPNTAALVASERVLEEKIDSLTGRSWCNVGLYIAGTRANATSLETLEDHANVCAIKVFIGSARGELLVDDDESIADIMRHGARRICFHSEDEARLAARKVLFKAGDPHRLHAEWHDVECAFLGTRRLVRLAEETGRQIHILHVSTAEELDYLKDRRDLATIELLVNHLTHYGPQIYDALGAYAVMNPPIRDRRHYDAAWAAVREGRVDCIGSDHAPHARSAKEKPWPDTAAGLTGVQTSVPVMLTHVNEGRLSLVQLVSLMAEGPARVNGAVGKGRIAVGYDADFTLVDMAHRRTIEESWIASPCGWSPFIGHACTGWPMMTIVGGNLVMAHDEVLGLPLGKPVAFAGSAHSSGRH